MRSRVYSWRVGTKVDSTTGGTLSNLDIVLSIFSRQDPPGTRSGALTLAPFSGADDSGTGSPGRDVDAARTHGNGDSEALVSDGSRVALWALLLRLCSFLGPESLFEGSDALTQSLVLLLDTVELGFCLSDVGVMLVCMNLRAQYCMAQGRAGSSSARATGTSDCGHVGDEARGVGHGRAVR